MAPTLSLFKSHSKQSQQSTHARPSVTMPSVLVTPPEEEQTPTWCCFEGNQSPDGPPPATINEITPAPSTSVFPTQEPSSPAPRHAVEVNDGDDTPADPPAPPSKEVGKESEVVEVVKVKRDSPGDSNTPKAKGLKARASKAFRSMRKSSKNPPPPPKVDEEDVFAPNEAGRRRDSFYNPNTASPPRPRRASFGITQIFQSTKPRPTSEPPSLSPYGRPSYSSTVPSLNFLNAEHIYPPEPGDELDMIRCSSPSPSTQTYKRRFSLMSLQKIFSFSQAGATMATAIPMDTELDGSGPMSPRSVPSLSRDSSGPSTISSQSGPDTPTDERSEDEQRDVREGDEDLGTQIASKLSREGDGPPLLLQELNFEIQLDSLHFDALSFNPDDF